MVVPIMDEVKKEECHMTSAVAFMEGGIQEPCDDACSICLEAFESDPSTVTSCKHEFHLQCILEWSQRSSNCPMCWRPISLKDPASQELLEGVEQERNIRLAPSRNTSIFHHPSLGDFELQHLPMGMNGSDLEDRIIQHLAAAAAMGRTHHRVARREGSRSRSSANARPQFVVFSANPNSSSNGSASPETELPATTITSSSAPLTDHNEALQQMSSSFDTNQISASSSGSLLMPTNPLQISNDNRSYVSQSSLPNQDAGGPSEFQSLSDNWKTKFSAISTKYKESISKSTRGWKEKLFSRSSSVADISSEVRREVNAGMATVSRMIERLETRENNRVGRGPLANTINPSVTERSNQDSRDISNETPSNGSDGNNSATFAANPISS